MEATSKRGGWASSARAPAVARLRSRRTMTIHFIPLHLFHARRLLVLGFLARGFRQDGAGGLDSADALAGDGLDFLAAIERFHAAFHVKLMIEDTLCEICCNRCI